MSAIDQSGYLEIEDRGAIAAKDEDNRAFLGARISAVGGSAKRAADMSLAGLALVMLSPLFLFVAVAVRLTSPGPVLYGHKRIGLGGRVFRCWKFRTMCTDAEAVLQTHLEADDALLAEWRATRKLRNDPRITRLGRVLREYSVDELPQLLNVLLGDMSLVGPRPVVEDELTRYGPQVGNYLAARPGITGLWQVSGRSDTTYRERVTLDSRYVLNWSFTGDLWIIVKTVPAVIGARGSY